MSRRRKSLSPEEKKTRAIRARMRFKALVRRVIANLYWLEDADEGDELGDNVLKNVQMLTKKKGKPPSLLTTRDKAILLKDKLERTEAEKNHLNRVIGGLKCFRRYPPNVKSQLAACTYFLYLGPGRVMVRQGGEAYALYFILEGEIGIYITSYDKFLKENVTVQVGTMSAGSMFGEVSLLHGINRTATCTTLTDCEMLEIKREDFDIVLKATVLEAWNDIQRCMAVFDYFQGWDEVATRECCILGKKHVYEARETILGDGYGLPNFVYFIVTGSCDVIEHLVIQPCYKGGKKTYRLMSPEIADAFLKREEENPLFGASSKHRISLRESRSAITIPKNVTVRLIRVCILNRLACFNLGENLKRRRIVAKTHTECLLIPTYWLFQKNKANIWNRVQQYLNQRIPKTEQIFRNFLDERKWEFYKKQLVEEIKSQKNIETFNSIHNVPYSIRMKELINYD